MSVATYTATGTKASTAAKLPKEVFGREVTNFELIQQAYVAHQANGRTNNARTLEKGEVRGGGRKPWKQKGTGRARVGSIRSPIWRGGGITFGPTGNENYTKSLSKTAKRTAVKQALSVANKSKKISVIEKIESKEGKTAPIAQLLDKVGAQRRTLVVVAEKNELIDRATRNISNTKTTAATYLNVFDIMNADSIVMTKDAVVAVDKWLGGKA